MSELTRAEKILKENLISNAEELKCDGLLVSPSDASKFFTFAEIALIADYLVDTFKN